MKIEINIPSALAAEGPRIKRFIDAMVHKLALNSHKPGFSQVDVKHCLARLQEETAELVEAIASGNSVEILLEAADVANFAMIGATAAIENPFAHSQETYPGMEKPDPKPILVGPAANHDVFRCGCKPCEAFRIEKGLARIVGEACYAA